LNRATTPTPIEFNWKDNPFNDDFSGKKADFEKETYNILDVWSNSEKGNTKKTLKVTIPAQDVAFYILSKK
jgi:hypothetical protein